MVILKKMLRSVWRFTPLGRAETVVSLPVFMAQPPAAA